MPRLEKKTIFSELYLSIGNKDLKKQCVEESDGIQLVEVFSQPSFSHIDVPYVLDLNLSPMVYRGVRHILCLSSCKYASIIKMNTTNYGHGN